MMEGEWRSVSGQYNTGYAYLFNSSSNSMTDKSNVTEFTANASLPLRQRESFERPITIAQGDTGQNRKVAGFLLAWWNAGENGGFNPIDLWSVDADIAQDMVEVFN